MVTKVDNSLSIVNPALAREWHPTKNGKLMPSDVNANSSKKVWWLFPYDDPITGKHYDFEWEASIHNRMQHSGCPFLTKGRVWEGFNDLATLRPDIAAQWHPTKNGDLKPSSVAQNSNKKRWWLFPYDDPVTGKHFDFEWKASPNSRISGNTGCPYLSGASVWKGFNDLETVNPSLALQWHPLKNGKLKPSDVTVSSGKKVWWLLPYDDPDTGNHFDFEWEAKINARTKSDGCPFLTGHRIWIGYNDLETLRPDLAAEWHPVKNGSLSPSSVMPYSMKKVWWYLPYDDPVSKRHFDFEWEAVIESRVKGSGCPYLSGYKVWPGYNDLLTRNPSLANEWHPSKNGILKPSDVTPASGKKVWWLCKKGHEWRALISNRAKDVGCPICDSERKTSSYEYAILYYLRMLDSSVEHTNRDYGIEIDIYIPSKRIGIEYDGEYWHKKNQRKDKKKNKICHDNNIRLYRFRENQLGGLDDTSVDISVNASTFNTELKKLIFEIYKVSLDIDIERDSSLIDELRVFSEKESSLSSIASEISEQWHPTKNGKLRPEHVLPNSNKKVWWLLPYDDPITGKHFDFEWKASVSNRYKGRACPYLSGHKVWTGYNDLATLKPDLSKEWNYKKNGNLSPSMVTQWSNKKVWWLLPYDDPETGKHFDFEWEESINSRVNNPGCPFLSGHRVWAGYNDLATLRPNLVSEWHPTKNGDLRPCDVTVSSGQKVWWLLPYDDPETGKHFDFEWKAVIATRADGIGCPFLSRRRVWSGYNDLATLRPDLAEEWHPTKNGNLRPSDVTVSSGKNVWWLLPYDDPETGKHFDFEWRTGIDNRYNGTGCPFLSNKAIWPGYNDLATLRPDLAERWNYKKNGDLCPDRVMPGSPKKVHWINVDGSEEYTAIRGYVKKNSLLI